MIEDLQRRLEPRRRSTPPVTGRPVLREFAQQARWTEPELVGEVEFRSWTRDGRLRHPSWRGLRPDKRTAEVRRRIRRGGGVPASVTVASARSTGDRALVWSGPG